MEQNQSKGTTFNKRKGIENTSGEELQLTTNYFKFKTYSNTGRTVFFKYSVDMIPDIPGDSVALRRKVWRCATLPVLENLGHTIFNNTMCYSAKCVNEPMILQTKVGETEYTVNVKLACQVTADDPESEALYKRFFSSLVRHEKLLTFRRNYFNTKMAKKIDGIEVWPGFNTTINRFSFGTLLNLNMIHRVLRPNTAYEEIMRIRNNTKNQMEVEIEIKNMFKGAVVLTRYNNDKTYIIDDVDFSKTPKTTFELKEGPLSFIEYYEKKYGREIKDKNQPMLVHIDKKKNNAIYLVPEFCFLTGLTDEMRSNFTLMKNLAQVTKPSAEQKLKEGIDLIESLLKSEKGIEESKKWNISIDPKPFEIKGRRLPAGNIVMATSKFDALVEDIDRKIQQQMLVQPVIKDIKVLVTNKDAELAQTFVNNLHLASSTFKYEINKPDVIQLATTNFREWETAIRTKTTPNTMMVVLILPGAKGKGQNYNELKRLLCTDCPIPSQVILSSTLKKDKGLRSVINKVLIQICAKVGGEPWAIDNLPFTDKPTMVMGIDVYQSKGDCYIGCSATFNQNFTKYFSTLKITTESGIVENIKSCVEESLANVSGLLTFLV
jgi:aubergine-like protein